VELVFTLSATFLAKKDFDNYESVSKIKNNKDNNKGLYRSVSKIW
jgi:hypothetical protein